MRLMWKLERVSRGEAGSGESRRGDLVNWTVELFDARAKEGVLRRRLGSWRDCGNCCGGEGAPT